MVLNQNNTMKFLLVCLLTSLTASADPIEKFVSYAQTKYGESGQKAARFLVLHMPENDKNSLSTEFLIENLDFAFEARKAFPWAAKVPESIFLNDVLPYAVFDETRDTWRKKLFSLATKVVKEAQTGAEAAQLLNKNIFNIVNVHYNTGRKRPNQSLKESTSLGMATCTGLSIILVEACRSVGIPARAVGTPLWTNGRGNHTWVEIWDGDWHFAGADEYDPKGLNRGWFVGDASKAKANERRHAIYATSWKRNGITFPMVWARSNNSVAAVNVTERYAKDSTEKLNLVELGVRLWDNKEGKRINAKVCVLDGVKRTCALDETKAGTADLNDMPRFYLPPGTSGWLQFTIGDEVRELAFGPLEKKIATIDAAWTKLEPAKKD